MRVTKEASVRKNEILDAAESLFLEQGYEKTSTSDILKRVGIARGTLYYHFSSKEEILEGVISRLVERNTKRAQKIARDPEKNVIEKLITIFSNPDLNNSFLGYIFTMIYEPEHAGLHQSLLMRLMESAVPVVAEIIAQGNEEGLFNTPYPTQSVQMMMPFVDLVLKRKRDWQPGEYEQTVEGFIFNAERLLGAAPGSLEDMFRFALDRVLVNFEKEAQTFDEKRKEELADA